MTVALLIVPFTTVSVLGAMVACAIAYSVLFKPLIQIMPKKPRKGWHRVTGFFKDVTMILPNELKRRANNFAVEHINVLIRTAASSAPPVTAALNQYEDTIRRIVGTLEDGAEQTFRALWTLNNETIPRKITAALIPIRNILDRHTDRLDALEDLNRRVAVELGDTLRGLPWGVPGGYVTNFAAFLNSYGDTYRHYWNVTRAQLNTLLGETIPELRRDVADLAQRIDVQIDARFDALRNRIIDLENQAAGSILPRLDNLEAAIDALSREIFGPVGTGLVALIARVTDLETWRQTVVEPALDALRAELAQLRTELEQGIETGLEAFRTQLERIELEVFTEIPQRLAAMQLAIDTIAAEIFEGVGAGLTALTERLAAIELEIGTIILPAIERIDAELETLRQTITGDIIPRITRLEGLLEPAAFAALVLAAMRIAAPNLFCRNVTDVTRRICATDEDFWAQLLAGTLLFALALDPRVIARAGQEVTGGMAALWRETAIR